MVGGTFSGDRRAPSGMGSVWRSHGKACRGPRPDPRRLCDQGIRTSRISRGELSLILSQVRHFDGSDEAPMPSNWTALEPPPAKPDRLQGSTWNPKRGEQVPTSASHRRVGTDHIATTADDNDGLSTEHGEGYEHDDLAAHGTRLRGRTPERVLRCWWSGQSPRPSAVHLEVPPRDGAPRPALYG